MRQSYIYCNGCGASLGYQGEGKKFVELHSFSIYRQPSPSGNAELHLCDGCFKLFVAQYQLDGLLKKNCLFGLFGGI